MTVREILESTVPYMKFRLSHINKITHEIIIVDEEDAGIVWEKEKDYFDFEIVNLNITPKAIFITI